MSDNPFGPLFGDLARLLGNQGPGAWFDTATQLATSIARGEDGDPNPEPLERQRLEELTPLVARHVDDLFGVAREPELIVTTRVGLATAALAQWRPLIEPALNAAVPEMGGDPAFAQMARIMGPLFAGFQLGSAAGHLTERAWSLAVIPLPRLDDSSWLCANNAAAFAESWSLTRDEVYVFALAQEFAAATILTRPGTGDALRALLLDTVREAQAVQGDLLGRIQGLFAEGDPSQMLSDPAALLEGIDLPDDSPATRAINAATAALGAVFELAALEVATRLLGPRSALAEAVRRHRLSDARGEEAASALFGIAARGEHLERASDFANRLVATHGFGAFSALLRVDGLPSDDELDAPERWWERVSTSPLA